MIASSGPGHYARAQHRRWLSSLRPKGRKSDMKALIRAAVIAIATLGAGSAFAEDTGSAAEAKALLNRAIVEVKTDVPAALAKFNDPNGSFRDRDLYVF